MRLRAKHLLYLWLAGFVMSLTIQSALQGWFAEVTVWGRNVGWQTEIAIWNAGMALVLAGVLRQSDAVHAAAVPGLTVLSFAFGVNHLQAVIADPGHVGHWMGAGANFTGVLLATLYFMTRSSTSGEAAEEERPPR